jgi:hypothetical protein
MTAGFNDVLSIVERYALAYRWKRLLVVVIIQIKKGILNESV